MKLSNSFFGCFKRFSLLLCILFCCVAAAWAQKTVTGTVVDNIGEPVIGANVLIKGTTRGVTTDMDGNFSITNVAETDILHVSFIGYTAQDVPVKGQSKLNITLAEDSEILEDVVVIGFGTVKKRDLTGSVASVKSETITQTPTASVTNAMQGRIAGLDVAPNADGDMQIRIRGNRSINGSNDPLVIIDGVQGGSMGDINPSDVESIDVLKDASSTAIYGSQGANGVIIITTKKAEKGKMNISYEGYVTGAFRTEHPDYRQGKNWYEARRIANANAGLWHSEADDRNLFDSNEAYAAYRAGIWTDYEDLLQKDLTMSNKHSVTISGGNEKTSGRFSLGYANDGSKWKNSNGTDKYTLRANIDHKVNKWLDAGITFQLTHNRHTVSPYEKATTTKVELGSPYGYFDADSETYLTGDELVQYPLAKDGYVNPLIDAEGDNKYDGLSYSTNTVANGYLDIHPLEGLTFRSQFNGSFSNSTSGSYLDHNAATNLGTANKSKATMSKASSVYMEWNNILTYNVPYMPKNHRLGVTALTSWGTKVSDNLYAASLGQTLASNLWWNLGSSDGAAGSVNHSSGYTKTQNFSYAFRVNYDWKSRYLFTASLRRDGASLLAKGHKWDTFPSAALAWRISDEAFMESTKSWLDDMKIRITNGVTGNSGIKAYGTQSGVTPKSTAFGYQDTAASLYIPGKFTPGTSMGNIYIIGNTDTKWERSSTFDLGFDATLLNSRINVVFDWYNTKTTDLLLLRSLPTSAGQDGTFATYTNIGDTRNRGFEVSINTRNIVKKDFEWSSTLTFSANSEKITDLIDGNDIQLGNDKESSTLMIGHPIKSYQAYVYQGIWKTSEAEEAATYFKDDAKTQAFEPGDFKVKDLNGDHVINNEDYTYLGSSTSPKWFAGFNNDFRYREWDLTIYMYARWGHWGQNPMASWKPNGGDYTNMNYWVAGSNEGGELPKLNASKMMSDYIGYQCISFVDQSFIKVKRITLGYNLSKKVLKQCGLQKARIYATVNDPIHWVKDSWMDERDPEGNQRSVTVGLNVNF